MSGMNAKFSLTPDAMQGLLRIWMGGFFEADDIERFGRAVEDALTQLHSRPNQHRTLVDIRAMDIQSGESVAGFQRLLANPRTAAKRIAFVIPKSLATMQVRRAAGNRDAAYFASVEAAEAWLLHDSAAEPQRRSAG